MSSSQIIGQRSARKGGIDGPHGGEGSGLLRSPRLRRLVALLALLVLTTALAWRCLDGTRGRARRRVSSRGRIRERGDADSSPRCGLEVEARLSREQVRRPVHRGRPRPCLELLLRDRGLVADAVGGLREVGVPEDAQSAEGLPFLSIERSVVEAGVKLSSVSDHEGA